MKNTIKLESQRILLKLEGEGVILQIAIAPYTGNILSGFIHQGDPNNILMHNFGISTCLLHTDGLYGIE